MKKVENKTLQVQFELVDSLTQGILEKFEAYLAKDLSEGRGIKTVYGKYLRAAIAVGWVKKPMYTNEQIEALDPRVVALVGEHLVKEYNEASVIPND